MNPVAGNMVCLLVNEMCSRVLLRGYGVLPLLKAADVLQHIAIGEGRDMNKDSSHGHHHHGNSHVHKFDSSVRLGSGSGGSGLV